jgi:transcriptional regulator with XRE-family HTH domain
MLRCISGVSKSKKRLVKAGWRVGTAAEFLHLTPEELARMLKSSQSRIAKMEKGDPSVSIDLLVKCLLALGTTRHEIAKAIA